MSTANEDEIQETKSGNDSTKFPEQEKLGALLKNKREAKGLTREELAIVTRLRVHFIEALENEDWDNLPSRVFVKGFIRSYAQAVDVDVNDILDLYMRVTPQKEEIPRPLVGSLKKTGSQSLLLIIIPIIIVVGIIFYFWIDSQKRYVSPGIMTSEETIPADETNVIQPSLQEREPPPLDRPPVWKGELRLLHEEVAVSDSISKTEELVLKGFVSMRTWVRVYIDNQLPKEYIFEPGNTHEWRAKEGFEILIGNAAGIEFDFNGKRIRNLGDPAKVVRLRLPENFKSVIHEE